MRKVGLWIVVAAMAGGCGLIFPRQAELEPGRVLFESFSVDTDWGYRLEGVYIESDGSVWRYHSEEPWYPNEVRTLVVREDDLLKKYRNAERVGRVEAETLRAMADLIPAASRAHVAGDPLVFERSGSLDVAYIYDWRERCYNQVLLDGRGAWVARNQSREAVTLVEWLRSVQDEFGFQE